VKSKRESRVNISVYSDNANYCPLDLEPDRVRDHRTLVAIVITPALIVYLRPTLSPLAFHPLSPFFLIFLLPFSPPMPIPTPSDQSPWPTQTPPPSHSRKRRILSPQSPLEHRTLHSRQTVFNETGVRTSTSSLTFSYSPRHEKFPTYPMPFLFLPHHVFFSFTFFPII
jgi:hypothetical protein